MKIFFGCLFVLALPFAQAQKRHVILISIDGFRSEMLDSTWPAPNIQQLKRDGVHATHLRSVFPSYTYPSHTAMITGALPARSNILFNQPKGSKGEWYWYFDSIKVNTLWQQLKTAGKTTAAIEWPVTIHAPITYNIPELWDLKYPDDKITAARNYATKGLVEEIEKNVMGKLDSSNYKDGCFCMDENTGKMAAYIFKKYQPDLLAAHFIQTDGMEHKFGREHDSVKLALATADKGIAAILQAVKEAKQENNTAIVIVGDHGMADIHEVFRVNMLLQDISARFTAAGGSAFLYSLPGSPKGRLNEDTIIQQVKDRLDALPTEKRNLFRIIERSELDKMGVDSAAILALAADPRLGLVFSGAIKQSPVLNAGPGTLIQQNSLEGVFIATKGGHHGYDPNEPLMHTGFIASGAGIRKGTSIKELNEQDIAPLIAKLLGIAFKAPDGKLVRGITTN